MFEGLKRQWREARGDGLRAEFEDAILRLNGLGPEVNARACLTLVSKLRQLEDLRGPLANVSNEGKRKLARKLHTEARSKFDFDMGAGYGLALLSLHLESHAVPGPDGALVLQQTTEMIHVALETERSLANGAEDDRSDQSTNSRAATSGDPPDGFSATDAKEQTEKAMMGIGNLTDPQYRSVVAMLSAMDRAATGADEATVPVPAGEPNAVRAAFAVVGAYRAMGLNGQLSPEDLQPETGLIGFARRCAETAVENELPAELLIALDPDGNADS